jgi:hypothetical protein
MFLGSGPLVHEVLHTMKRILLLFALASCAASSFARTPEEKKTSSKKSDAAKTAIPDDAVEVEPGLYRAVDKKGETWFYRRTPFGVSKYKAEEAAPAAVAPDSDLKVADLGETVRFERKTPFGVRSWTKKKSELNKEEAAALEKEAVKTAPHEKPKQ